MKIFVSWSGAKSKALATIIREWLKNMFHFAEPWMSDMDITAGLRWNSVVATELDQANFGIICLTAENKDAPWLLFESGALAKSLEEGRVIPLLLGLEFQELTSPLSQFQSKKCDRNGFVAIAAAVNDCAGNGGLPVERLNALFDAFWPGLDTELKLTQEIPVTQIRPMRDTSEVLEELVDIVRTLDLRFEDLEEAVYDLVDANAAKEGFSRQPIFDEQYSNPEMKERLKASMSWLTPRERDVIRLRFGLDDDRLRTQREVARLFNVSPARISQIQSIALRKLRSAPQDPRSDVESNSTLSTDSL